MPSLPAPSPDPGKDNTINSALRFATENGTSDGADDIADPVMLFSKDYDDKNGRVQDISIASGEKRPASPRRKLGSAAHASSPAKKKSNNTSSPARIAFNAAARVAVAAIASGDISLPHVIARVDHSPTSVLGDRTLNRINTQTNH